MENKVDTGINITVTAPGKVILHGEHSVVYGRLAVAASIDLRTKLCLTEIIDQQHDNLIVLEFQNIKLMQSFYIQDLKRLVLNTPIPLFKNSFNIDHPEYINHNIYLDQIEKFVKLKANVSEVKHIALVSFLYLYCAILGPSGVPLLPIKLVLNTELTVGAGLGSSASFLVTIVAGLIEYIKIQYRKTPKIRQANFDLSLDNTKVYTEKELHLISKWAFNAEKIIHGTPSGVDNTICTFGSFVKYRKSKEPEPLELNHKVQVLLINTKIPKNTKALVAKVAILKENHENIIEPVLDAMEAIAQSGIECLLKLGQISNKNFENIQIKHSEITDCYKKIGELTDINQNLLRGLGVSHNSLDSICSMLTSVGLHGKLTGAGGGGYAISILPIDFDPTQLEFIKNKLTLEGFEVLHAALGGTGVILQ